MGHYENHEQLGPIVSEQVYNQPRSDGGHLLFDSFSGANYPTVDAARETAVTAWITAAGQGIGRRSVEEGTNFHVTVYVEYQPIEDQTDSLERVVISADVAPKIPKPKEVLWDTYRIIGMRRPRESSIVEIYSITAEGGRFGYSRFDGQSLVDRVDLGSVSSSKPEPGETLATRMDGPLSSPPRVPVQQRAA